MKEMTRQKVAKVKGRAMLHWVGKKPLEMVQGYPAQLCETFFAPSAPPSSSEDRQAVPTFGTLQKNWHNLLFLGDNKEILSTLLINGFRGKIDLIYIDPPFDSGADYIRKVELRGTNSKMEGEAQSIIEQIQYTDIWANDNYLQFMYERLILLRELLSEQGSIYLHCDWHKSHHLRFLLDEVFGADNFINEIVWVYSRMASKGQKFFNSTHQNLICYSKSNDNYIFNLDEVREEYAESSKNRAGYRKKGVGSGIFKEETLCELNGTGKFPDDWWDIPFVRNNDYPTQKPEALLERIIKASSHPDSIVLDCFVGSGTTLAAAQKLGRRWIGADLNKGALQTTAKRLQRIIVEQERANGSLNIPDKIQTFYPSFLLYRVNNYDFQDDNTLRRIVFEKYGIEKLATDVFFDGLLGQKLVKILAFNKPLTKLDLQLLKDELSLRTEEERDILLICSGAELGMDEEIARYNRLRPINKIEKRDIQRDGIIAFEAAQADVTISKQDKKAIVVINDYLSPTILKRMELDRTVFDEKLGDFRSQIDVVLLDTNYDGKTFNICFSDIPARKKDLVVGRYELEITSREQRIAVKIIDMLGEETLIVE